MTTHEMDEGTPSLTPHSHVLNTPEGGNDHRPSDPGTDIPAKPGQPTPYPEHPDLPGGPPEPVEPGQGQPIPPEMGYRKPSEEELDLQARASPPQPTDAFGAMLILPRLTSS